MNEKIELFSSDFFVCLYAFRRHKASIIYVQKIKALIRALNIPT